MQLETYGPKLLAQGYPIIPISKGKKFPQGTPGWQDFKADDQLLSGWINGQFKDGGVGILTKNLPAIDIDVYDREVAEKVSAFCMDHIGNTTRRVGMPPKLLLPFRTDEPFKKMISEEYYNSEGKACRVEILGDGQQFVAYAIHPNTGMEYFYDSDFSLADIPADELPELTPEKAQAVLDFFDELAKEKGWQPVKEKPVSDTSCISDDFTIPQGSRNGELASIAGTLRRRGIGQQAIATALGAINQAHCDQPLSDNEIGSIAYSVGRYEPEGMNLAASITPTACFNELVWAKSAQPYLENNYLIKSLIDAGGLSVIYGESNSGKSFFSIDLGMKIATGVYWRGRNTKQGVVIYIASEGARSVENRVYACMKYGSKAERSMLAIYPHPINLLRDGVDSVNALKAMADQIKDQYGHDVVLFIFDTLARSMAGGNENAFEDMSLVVENADRLRHATTAHVMFIHHSGKDTAKGARGHSSLRAATDTEIEVFAGKDNGKKTHTAFVSKQRDHEIGEEFYFTLEQQFLGFDEDRDKVTTCTVSVEDSGVSKKKKKGKLGKNQQIALDALDVLEKADTGGGLEKNIRFSEWKDHFTTRFLTLNGKEPTKYQWRDAWNSLVDKGLVDYDKALNTVKTA